MVSLLWTTCPVKIQYIANPIPHTGVGAPWEWVERESDIDSAWEFKALNHWLTHKRKEIRSVQSFVGLMNIAWGCMPLVHQLVCLCAWERLFASVVWNVDLRLDQQANHLSVYNSHHARLFTNTPTYPPLLPLPTDFYYSLSQPPRSTDKYSRLVNS